MTAAYLRILIHNMNNSLFPDADPSSVTWDGPPPGIVTVQSLLYGSLATSLFAAFIAMLGKQWVSRYLRKQGGSAAEKSRDRQQKARRVQGVALSACHRKPPCDAPVRVAVAWLCPNAISVDNQPNRCRGYHGLHAFWTHLIHLLHSRRDSPLQLSLSDTPFHPHQSCHPIPSANRSHVRSLAAIAYLTHPIPAFHAFRPISPFHLTSPFHHIPPSS